VPYEKAWEFQKELVEKRIQDEIPDTVLFVEHPPTVTRGRGLQWSPARAKEAEEGAPPLREMPIGTLPGGTEYFAIERGGDLTWHGPGQLVIYPIVKLDGSGFGPNHDVTGYLRKLERVLGEWLVKYGLRTVARENATGIWVEPSREGFTSGAGSKSASDSSPKKIASIGIAVRKWVTYHGIGMNIANSLEGYRDISPCGFSPEVMTTLAGASPTALPGEWTPEVRARIESEIAAQFSAAPLSQDPFSQDRLSSGKSVEIFDLSP
jgi:lipoyl(octanoyl) transferase